MNSLCLGIFFPRLLEESNSPLKETSTIISLFISFTLHLSTADNIFNFNISITISSTTNTLDRLHLIRQ